MSGPREGWRASTSELDTRSASAAPESSLSTFAAMSLVPRDCSRWLTRVGLVVLAALVLPSAAARSQPSIYELEPNDTPAEANPLSGEAVLLGTMNDEDQDGFLWTVSDEDAQKRWILELHGIPGRLTIAEIVRLEYADNGVDVTGKETLMKMGTRDGSTPAVTRDLIFEPGEYLIGIAYAGGSQSEASSGDQRGGMFRPPATNLSFGEDGTPEGAVETVAATAKEPGAYRFVIREGSKLYVVAEHGQGAERSDAHSIRPGRETAPFETRSEAWYALELDAAEADQRWDIRVQVPVARVVDATLLDAEGNELDGKRSDQRGRLVFPGITPRETPYLVKVEPHEPGFVTAIGSEAVGRRVDGEEAEPNGKWELANRVDLSQPLTARVDEANETDYFRFSLDEETSDRLLSLRLATEPEAQKVLFCLHDADDTRLQCRDAQTPIELPDLLLAAGDWGLSVSRTKSEFDYTVTLSEQGRVEPGREVEPNDSIEIASTVPVNNRIKGRASGKENDFFRFMVAEEPQLWRFQVIGDGVIEIAYHDGSGRQLAKWRPQRGQRRLRLDNLFLLPGKHYVRVYGEDGAEYTLLARALGPPDPNGEREPNDDTSRMQRLEIGQTRTGLLADANDRDYYRFFLANWDHIRLTVEPPPDGIASPDLYWYGQSLFQGMPSEVGEVMSVAGVFPPGDYHLQLSTREPSDAEYRLRLERLPRYSCAADCEPNGRAIHLAAPLPPDLVLEGVSGDWRDLDTYGLPVLSQPSRLAIRGEKTRRIYLGPKVNDWEALTYDAESGSYSTTVPAGEPYRLFVESGGEPYRLELEFEHGPEPLADTLLPAELELELDHEAVSAFRAHGQRVAGRLAVANKGSGRLEGRLEVTASDHRWTVALDESELAVPAGGRMDVPAEVLVPPDAWADRPVRISARLLDDAGRQVETWTEVAVDRDLPSVEPAWNWPIPDSLRGGFNAAWLPFGGRLVGEIPRRADDPQLRDGLVFEGRRVHCCGETYGWKDTRPAITLELPGDEAMPVAGVALNLFGAPGPYRNLRRGTLLLSEDGRAFDEVLAFETLPVRSEQYFALETPVMARFARLRLEETYEQRSGAGGVTLGEWKVILAPGHDLSAGRGFDLADPELGGHLVWDWPPQPYSPVSILDEGKRTHGVRGGPDELLYVIGFHEDRAAQIRRVEWVNSEDVRSEYALERVLVSVSTESPVGPWTPVGELDPGDRPGPSVLELEEPVWARFVRFLGVPQEEARILAAPEVIRIWERPTADEYRSMLGEWGHGSRKAFYEEQMGIPDEPELKAANNLMRETAAPLEPGERVSGQVALAKRSHWYRFEMPADTNTLTIAMTGRPTIRTVLALEGAQGMPIPLRRMERESTPRQHLFEAFAEPGSTVYLHVSEPPRNVVFSWDTSASVNAHLPTIYNSLAAFTNQVVPGRESVNFVPFGRGPLLDSWLGEPYMLQTILNDYPRRESSSAGERALQTAAHTLAPVAGTKAIMLITDGAVNHHGPMWKEMREIQPRIFGVGVAGFEAQHHDVFQDWASVNGGHFAHILYQGEMEVAFDRAATLMRRPADYVLEVEAEFRQAPGPGTLRVVGGGDGGGAAALGDAAVELILDASGSMLQRMGGKRRIVVAKEVLTEAVREHLPAGMPVALRVFGHEEPGTCATELEIPLGPLDPDRAAAAISAIQAKNLAKTPIAESLAAVPRDLEGAKAAAVVLVTDGEETCDGDPAAVIESLAEKGVEVTVNIVGFAIDDQALERQFAEWAELGGGRYFSASDEQGLSEALEDALQVPYEVLDAGGERVAEGLVGGEPVELEQGVYRVVVGTVPPQTFDQVEVVGEQEARLELPGG